MTVTPTFTARNAALAACVLAGCTYASAHDQAFEKTVQPFVAQHCYMCHNDKLSSGGLNLKAFQDTADVDSHRAQWEVVLDKLKSGQMPPKGIPKPPAAQVDAVTTWIDHEFARLDKQMKPEAGRVTARRLNRAEYNNTIRDLVGVDFHPAKDFPADDFGYGFDNIGDVLSVSPVLMEKYLAAAEKITKSAILADPPPKPTLAKIRSKRKRVPAPPEVEPETATAPVKSGPEKTKPKFKELTPPVLVWKRDFAWEADYKLRVNVNGRRDPGDLEVLLDGKPLGRFQLHTDRDMPRLTDLEAHIGRGEHTIEARFIKVDRPPDPEKPLVFKPGTPPARIARIKAAIAKAKREAPPAGVDFVELRGPFSPVPPPLSDSEKKIFICGHDRGHHTQECARIDLADFARRAWRRPVTDAEVDKLVGFVKMAEDNGDTFEQAMRIGVDAVLVSPRFLFRIERDPVENANADGKEPAHRLNDFELATRLSYFLWSSMPDEQLFRLASENRLHKDNVLRAQVRRMLDDPKSKALVDNFAGQWLELRNLDSIKPDPDKFPEFNDKLRAAMKQETTLFFNYVVHQDRSILDFLDGHYTFLNERLAKFYGIPGITGDEFRRVDLTGNTERSGVLTQASVLTVSSYPTRTSPVIRGKWILENLLNAAPPPPPANVPALDASEIGITGTMRQQLEKHRSNPMCASCHSRMDPLGFGLENYDGIGRWRTMDGKFPIDATGTLPNGKSFSSPEQMKQILLADKDQFTRALVEKLMTYALGRGLETYDRPEVNLITKHVAQQGYRFSALVMAIAKSVPFEMRRPEVVPAAVANAAPAVHTIRRGGS